MTIEEKIPSVSHGRKARGIGVLSDPPKLNGQAVDDRIKKSELAKGKLEVILDGLTNEGGGSATLFLHKPDGTKEKLETKSLEGVNLPLMFNVDSSKVPELPTPEEPTPYSFSFEILDADGNEDHSTSPKDFAIGKIPPWGKKTPFSKGLVPKVTYVNAPAGGILDAAWFAANLAGLRCKAVITYDRYHAQDRISFFLTARAVPTTGQTPVYEGVLDANGEFVVPPEKLKALGNTTLYQTNFVTDVAEFQSADAVPAKDLEIRVPPAPTFYPAEVAATGPEGTTALTLANFNPVTTNVTVLIKRPLNADPTAEITASLNGEVIGNKPVGATGDVTLDLTYDIFDKVYDTSIGEIPAEITYTYKVGAGAAEDSKQTTYVFLNGTYPGPVLLPEPDLNSENLPPVQVFGDTGELNHLVPGDFGKPVKFKFTKWVMDVGDDLVATATVTFYYNNVYVGDTTIDPGQNFAEIKVEFNKVSIHGTGIKEAYCTLEYLGNANIVKQKLPTEVTFEANEVKLLEHTAKTFNTDRVISCPSFDVVGTDRLWRVSVPKAQPSLPVAQSITLQAQGYEDKAMTTPLGAPHTETKPVANTAVDLVFDVPFAFVKGLQGPVVAPPGTPIYHYVQVWYETTIVGQLYNSPKVLHRVNVRNTSSLFCDGTK